MSNIVVPELGESVVEARVASWLKKEGDRVEVGDPLVELETEKIDLEVSADKRGVITSIARKEGEDVKIGELLAVVDENGAGAGASTRHAAPAGATATDEPASATPTDASADRDTTTDSALAPPREAKTQHDRTDRTDSATASHRRSARPIAPTRVGDRTEERVRMSKRRQTIARRLVEAQHTAAMLTTFNEVDMTAIMALRERRKESFKKEFGVGLGIASFFVKASIAALRAFPAAQRRDSGRRDRLQALLRHRHGGRRRRRTGRPGDPRRRPDVVRADRDRRSATSRSAPPTAR